MNLSNKTRPSIDLSIHPDLGRVCDWVNWLDQRPQSGIIDMCSAGAPGMGMPHCHAGEVYCFLRERGRTDEDYCINDVCIAFSAYLFNENPNESVMYEYAYGFSEDDTAKLSRIELWARCNPELWGNENGSIMFARKATFDDLELTYVNASDQCITRQRIKEHWEGVLERLEAVQTQECLIATAELEYDARREQAVHPQLGCEVL